MQFVTSGNHFYLNNVYRFEKCKLKGLGIEDKYKRLLLQFDEKIDDIKKVL